MLQYALRMDDRSEEHEMTLVLRWQPTRQGDDPRVVVRLEDEEGRMWDPLVGAASITGFLPAGWAKGGALTFKRTIDDN